MWAPRLLLVLLLRLGAGGGGFLGEAHHHPVGHAQVDGDDVLLQKPLVAFEPHEAGQRPGRVVLGQAHVDAVEL